MNNAPFNIDYYILGGDGEILDARSAQIFAVASETDFEDVQELVEREFDYVEALDIMPTLKFLPEPSAKPVNMADLLTTIANGWSNSLNREERMALLRLRDELPEVYQ